MLIEIWKPVVGLEGLYEVSSIGRVRNVDRLVERTVGRGSNPDKPYVIRRRAKVRALYETADGYMQVKLTKRGSVSVHTLVLESFVGPCPDGLLARHLDDVGSNNTLDNLRWGTPKENSEDMVRNGKSCRGERQGRSKLSEVDVVSIRTRPIANFAETGREFGVTGENIRRIVNRETWRHVA